MPQSTIRFGRPSLARHDPDYMTSVLLTHILGGGSLSSRLFREVREKRGLAYSVSTSVSTLDHANFLHGGTATKNERAKESLDVIAEQIRDLSDNGPNDDELVKGKKYLVGSYPLRFDTSAKIAGQLVHIQLEGFGPEWMVERNRLIEAATMDDARRVAKRLFGDGGDERGDRRAPGRALGTPAARAVSSRRRPSVAATFSRCRFLRIWTGRCRDRTASS